MTYTAAGPVTAATPQPERAGPRVLLVAEGTYPHQWGGVSTWCDELVRSLPDVPFWIWAITPKPGMSELFHFPPNVQGVVSVPLWNVRDIKESWTSTAGARSLQLHRSRRAATEESVAAGFVPSFRSFVSGVFHDEADAHVVALAVHAMYRFLLEHDLFETLGTRVVWDAYVDEIKAAAVRDAPYGAGEPLLTDVSTGFAWVTRWLFPIARAIPKVDVVHLAMNGVCCMTAAAATLEHGAGFLLTEHGIYLRERYLAAAADPGNPFLKLLALRFARRMTELGYALAGQISPCCDYNQRWEREFGVEKSRLATIYYGLDSTSYSSRRPLSEQPRCIVWVGRINPLKDVETLLRACAVVVREEPDVRFRLYGSAPAEDADYHKRCLALHVSLGLQDAVEFCGFTSSPVDAYNEGDIVVMSSVSEGLPFSILEAMLCGRPVVSTSVGGIPEGLEGVGLVVEPRDPEALGQALLSLVQDPPRCHKMGADARRKAETLFGIERFAGDHRSTYLRLSSPEHQRRLLLPTPRRGGGPVRHRPGRRPAPRKYPVAEVTFVDERYRNAFEDLLRIVISLDPNPFDRLEVAAIIESGGVTDVGARERYGFPDTFALAAVIFDAIRRARPGFVAAVAGPAGVVPGQVDGSPETWLVDGAPADAGQAEGGVALPVRVPSFEVPSLSHLDSARHPTLAVVPSAALLTVIWLLSAFGRFTGERVLALTVGMSLGMLCTNGIALGMGRRASQFISLRKVTAARRYIAACTVVGVLFTALVSDLIAAVSAPGLDLINRQAVTFVLAATAIAPIWILASAMSLMSLNGMTGIAICAGAAAGVVADRATVLWLGAHVLVGIAVGTTTALAVLVWSFSRALQARYDRRADADRSMPSISYMAVEASPSFLYGTLGVVMFAAVHVLGWIAARAAMPKVATLELGLFLTLGPAVLSMGHAERTIRLFWLRSAGLQRSVNVWHARRFSTRLLVSYFDDTVSYVRAVVVMSVISAVIIEAALRAGLLHHMVPPADVHAFRVVYVSSLVAYGLLGWGQFGCMYGLSLGRWQGPLIAVTAGATVTVLCGTVVVLCAGFAASPVALIAGAAVFGALGHASARLILSEADRNYVHAL